MLDTPSEDLPAYQVRISPRVKRMQLKVSPWGKVEVVIPWPSHKKRVAEFVARHQVWLTRTLNHYDEQRAHNPEWYQPLPGQLQLLALNQHWQVEYHPGRAKYQTLGGTLAIACDHEVTGRQVLRDWLTATAKTTLVPQLAQLSQELSLPCNRVSIRAQKSRWGSCSASKNINLNRNLLFLPPALVRYLMIHELCHTVHMNHSQRYWSMVESMQPEYQELDRQLRDGYRYVPLWAYPEID